MLDSLLPSISGKLTCNDTKMSRLGQLRRALLMYIPLTSELNEKIVLKRKDGADFETWDEEDIYDKVLVDAPCTTDRISVNQDEGNVFSLAMTQERLNLPQLQTRLLMWVSLINPTNQFHLSNALRATKVGGSVVYSTCTLSPTQNECVVENTAALARQHFGIEVVEQSLSQLENQLRNTHLFRFSEKCQRGTMVVPFIRSNYGPMYVCKLLRTRWFIRIQLLTMVMLHKLVKPLRESNGCFSRRSETVRLSECLLLKSELLWRWPLISLWVHPGHWLSTIREWNCLWDRLKPRIDLPTKCDNTSSIYMRFTGDKALRFTQTSRVDVYCAFVCKTLQTFF